MAFYPELVGLGFAELIRAFEQPNHPEGAIFYQEVACSLRTMGDLGVGYLLGKLTASRLMHVRGAILGLTFPSVEDPVLAGYIQRALEQMLNSKHAIIVMDAIDALRSLNSLDMSDHIQDRVKHPSPYVRGAVVRYVAALLPENIPRIVIPALRDEHYIVRESAIDALDDYGYVDAYVDALRALLADSHPHIRQAAATALEHLL